MILRITVLSIVLVIGMLAVIAISATITDKLLVSGYIDDNEDDNEPMCKSSMTAVAQPGNQVIGQGEVTGIKYYIELQPGWEQSDRIDFLVYDVGPTFCTSVPISNFTRAINGKISMDLECQFRNYNCFYYSEYDHIEEQAEKYWSKVPYIGGARVYKYP